MRTIATFLAWLGNLLLDWSLRLEFRDWPPAVEWTDRPDVSHPPFMLPPDIEPMERQR